MSLNVDQKRATTIFLASLIVYGLTNLAILLNSSFHAFLNDFWLLRDIARAASPGNLQAYFDGFFPYLYPALLQLIPDSLLLPVAGLLSLLTGLAAIALVYLTASRLTNFWCGLIAAWIVAIFPLVFTYMTNLGPDVVALLPVALALYLLGSLVARPTNQQRNTFIVIGILIGIAASLRYHAGLIAIVPFAYIFLTAGERFKRTLLLSTGLLLGYLPQIIISFVATGNPISTFQGFNAYRQVNTIDWNTTSNIDIELYSSVQAVILNQPCDFTIAYLSSITNFAFPLLVLAFAYLFNSRGRLGIFYLSVLIGGVAYAAIVSLAFSERSLILFIPLWGLAAAGAIFGFISWFQDVTKPATFAQLPISVGVVVAVLVGTFSWISSDVQAGIGRSELERSRVMNANELEFGAVAMEMSQVFSNDFNFYSLNLGGYTPRYNGGLQRVGIPGRELVREVDTSSIDAFLCSAGKAGIKSVVWNANNVGGTEASLAALLAGETQDPRFIPIPSIGLRKFNLDLSIDPCR